MEKPTKTNALAAVKRRFQGVVMTNAQDKTLIVKVDRVRIHRLYKKRYTTSQRYHVHDEKNQYKVGDVVDFTECRPLSKHKRWRVIYSA